MPGVFSALMDRLRLYCGRMTVFRSCFRFGYHMHIICLPAGGAVFQWDNPGSLETQFKITHHKGDTDKGALVLIAVGQNVAEKCEGISTDVRILF